MPLSVFIPVWVVIFSLVCLDCVPMAVAPFVALFLMGLIFWSFFEYLGHRFLFHLDLSHEIGKRFIFLIHGNHHDEPGEKLRNMMPLSVSLPLAGLLWGLAHFLGGHSGTTFFLGFLAGYIVYDLVHYACHQYRPKRGILRKLRRHHLIHHYAAPEKNFAVSNDVWDRIFHTKTGRSP
ncbi:MULTISPECIES: sterol desaturase family protein [Gluconobacter]|uniref:sterol desaturase family protein n=1 Tax=Gluconobacter TaxID=441 RepID=UPI00130244EC|nr:MULTISPECIES: sterol desaturase family protein [Gluconobacter]MBS1038466.1 sterol desaturase family protein [Gluconobacter cerinus]